MQPPPHQPFEISPSFEPCDLAQPATLGWVQAMASVHTSVCHSYSLHACGARPLSSAI